MSEFVDFYLIRPEQLAAQAGLRFYIQNNIICIQEHSEFTFFLYDLRTHKEINRSSDIVSPWILMDDQSPIHQADEARLIKNYSRIFIDNQPLNDALNHPNPHVRESAKRVLSALNIPIPQTQP